MCCVLWVLWVCVRGTGGSRFFFLGVSAKTKEREEIEFDEGRAGAFPLARHSRIFFFLRHQIPPPPKTRLLSFQSPLPVIMHLIAVFDAGRLCVGACGAATAEETRARLHAAPSPHPSYSPPFLSLNHLPSIPTQAPPARPPR